MLYLVKSPILHNHVLYKPGDTIDLSESEAEPLKDILSKFEPPNVPPEQKKEVPIVQNEPIGTTEEGAKTMRKK